MILGNAETGERETGRLALLKKSCTARTHSRGRTVQIQQELEAVNLQEWGEKGCVAVHSTAPALRRLTQEDQEFKASPRLCLKN